MRIVDSGGILLAMAAGLQSGSKRNLIAMASIRLQPTCDGLQGMAATLLSDMEGIGYMMQYANVGATKTSIALGSNQTICSVKLSW